MTTGSPLTMFSHLFRPPVRVASLGCLLLASLGCQAREHTPELERDAASVSAVDARQKDDEAADKQAEGKTAEDEAKVKAKAESKRKEKMRAKTREIEKKERALHVAQLELKLARRAVDEGEAEHAWSVAQAARKSDDAARNLGLFGELEQPLKEAERVLAVDRALRWVHDARTDLAGILAIYAEETEASSKEEIIARHRRTVEFAERALAIQQQKGELALRNEEQDRERKLLLEVKKAQRGVDHEQHEREQARVTGELDLMKKEHALIEIEEELQDLRNALRKLKKAAPN